METLIRQAVIEDVPFIARCVLAAVDLYDFSPESLIDSTLTEEVCGRGDTLYSWRNTRIAYVEGGTVGCLVSYRGDNYVDVRERTFDVFRKAGHDIPKTDIETGPGEWYLDSMAIVPEFRGHGIGHILMKDGIEIARKHGLHKVALIVECSKPHLRDYYARLGFLPDHELDAFGDRYLKMTLAI